MTTMRSLMEAVRAEPPSDGRIFHHGTTADFEQFEAQPDSHLGFHFGTADQARRILGRKQGRIIQATLSYQRPLRTVDAGDWSNPYQAWEAINRALGGPKDVYLSAFFNTLIDPEMTRQEKLSIIRQRVEAAGYDAIVYRNRIEGKGDSVIVFHPEQIKVVRTGLR